MLGLTLVYICIANYLYLVCTKDQIVAVENQQTYSSASAVI